MKYSEILTLLDKGFTVDQIMTLAAQSEPAPLPEPTPQPDPAPLPEPTPQPDPAPLPEPTPQPEPAPQPQATLVDVLNAVKGLTMAVQASAIMSAQQPEGPKNPDALDIMRQIASPLKRKVENNG